MIKTKEFGTGLKSKPRLQKRELKSLKQEKGEFNMTNKIDFKPVLVSGLFSLIALTIGCQTDTANSNANLVNANANIANAFTNSANTNTANMNSSVSVIESKEPEVYQAMVKLSLEALGDEQKAKLPTIGANVARSGAERRMEITLPNNEKVVYLDKAGTNYLILPNRKQYAELNKESVGFDVRRFLTPDEIVKRVQNMQGVQKVGEEQMNGRTVIKYRYGSVANTQTQAGQVETESFLIIDKETGLPLRSETVSQSQTGGNVQGYKGLRLVTEMSDIKTTAEPTLFEPPTGFEKVEAEQVRSQVNLILQVIAGFLQQAVQTAQPAATPMSAPAASPGVQ